jgi:hypothetical protein
MEYLMHEGCERVCKESVFVPKTLSRLMSCISSELVQKGQYRKETPFTSSRFTSTYVQNE